jgi:hypothetical protein
MQQIKIPVSQRDAFARPAPLLRLLAKLASVQDFVSCAQ